MVQNHSPDCWAGNQADDLVNNRTNHHNQQRNAYDRPEVFFKKFPSAHDAVTYIQLVIARQDRFNRRQAGTPPGIPAAGRAQLATRHRTQQKPIVVSNRFRLPFELEFRVVPAFDHPLAQLFGGNGPVFLLVGSDLWT